MNQMKHAALEEIPAVEEPRMLRLCDLVEDLLADAEAAHAAHATNVPRGPLTRLAAVDGALGGFLSPGVHLLQAAPGAGKTAFCVQVAVDCGRPALLVTAETPPLELFRRVIARLTKTDVGTLKSGKLAPSQVADLARQTAAQASQLAILDVTLGFVSASGIRSAAEALRSQFSGEGLLIVIDPLQNWARAAARDTSEYELVSAGVEGARKLAVELACPVLAVSQRNRAGQREGGLHAGKGSGDLEYAAETVLELTPDGAPNPQGVTKVTLRIHKNRHGRSGVALPLEFDGPRFTFREN